ncbi:Hypothetical protein R9X50_00397100 [Acrodontium crateriforme]|uniref:N-acetyltransferase domain-containing protein n=1 Tax=Acrodontium crateriforme TaxID=150365 RepID=A0AAQ3M759_9PEZI|nr:Hypothetical protein R9X50_00397100 [Acrodontium crateriforme]
MKVNEETALSTAKLLLVPYSRSHVETYHEWMKDPSLQAATASEPLSLDEEYEMQRSWRTDNDKLTFIINLPRHSPESKDSVNAGTEDCPQNMIGDINLFLSEPDSDDEGLPQTQNGVIGEIELMIARVDLQRKGYGRSAVQVFTNYVLKNWDAISKEYSPAKPALAYFRVKINQANSGSIKLFEKIGFDWVSETANYFGEVELRWSLEKAARSVLEMDSSGEIFELQYTGEHAEQEDEVMLGIV